MRNVVAPNEIRIRKQALDIRTKNDHWATVFFHSYFRRHGAWMANKKRLQGESAPHSYFVRQMGRPGEQNTTLLRRYRKLFVFRSLFSRHGALNTNKKQTKNESVPKVDMFRIPFVKWSPRHLYGDQKTLKKLIVRKSFVFCSPGNILSCHLVEGREPKYFWINNNCSPGRLSGEQKTTLGRKCLAFVFCSPNGSPWRTKYDSITKI